MHTNVLATCLCLCLFEKPKKEYFLYFIECPTSIWLLISAMNPSGSAPRLSELYVIFIRQSVAAGEPKAFSSKGERRVEHPLGASANPPHPEWNKATERRETHRPAPALHHRAGTHAPVSLQGAACARGYPWVSSVARPTPPRTARVPRQLLYLLNLATAGY